MAFKHVPCAIYSLLGTGASSSLDTPALSLLVYMAHHRVARVCESLALPHALRVKRTSGDQPLPPQQYVGLSCHGLDIFFAPPRHTRGRLRELTPTGNSFTRVHSPIHSISVLYSALCYRSVLWVDLRFVLDILRVDS